jgi:hypothetical protein
MKLISLLYLLLSILNPSFAQIGEAYDRAIIRSIDDYDQPTNYVEVSEEGLPQEHYNQLIQQLNAFRFTLLTPSKVDELFENLTRNSQARMRQPGGLCSRRRAYIQNLFKQMDIVSGKILIKCPSNNGRLRLQDQVSRRYYTFSNFHDTNIVAVKTNTGVAFRVLDLQFQDNPISLHDYLSQIETLQRIRPIKRRGTTRSLCYWSISTSFHTF